MLYFGRVGSLWGICTKVGSSWEEKVITLNDFLFLFLFLKTILKNKTKTGLPNELGVSCCLLGKLNRRLSTYLLVFEISIFKCCI
jgi:hypothetical protein